MIPLELRSALVFLLGLCLGSLVNWAIYSLAWHPRPISPWSKTPAKAPSRRAAHRIPVFGWFLLRHEAHLHGRGFWIRPILLELGLGLALAALYWWEIGQQALVQEQISVPVAPPLAMLHLQFLAHALLLCWMLAASFIDIDEKIIPDEITVSGTLLGLVLAALVPTSLLPHVAERSQPPVIGALLKNPAGMPMPGPNGQPLYVEPVTAVAPAAWPATWGESRKWKSLAVAVGCYWLWCFALAPRIWRGRRGAVFAMGLIAARLRRELGRPPLLWLLLVGTAGILCIWAIGGRPWAGLLTALVGLVASGGIVWAVRLMGTAALRREAMGFGDVTLMMMVGTFLGWQACLIAFFLAPFAALIVGLAQFVLRRDDVIPYGPFLCLGSAAVVIFWAPIWIGGWWGHGLMGEPIPVGAKELFSSGGLVPAVLVICLVLLGVMLAIWQMIKTALFGAAIFNHGDTEDTE